MINPIDVSMKNQIITLLQKLNPVLLSNHPEPKQNESPAALTRELKLLYNQIKNVVIVRLDAIGDSLLFVNAMKQIKELFPQAAITFVCYKETAEIISRSPYIDVPVYLDRKKLEVDKNYRESIYTALGNYSFDVLINPLYSREFFSEEIVYFINAELKIGFKGDVSNISPLLLGKTNNWYDILLETENTINKFELYRNAELVNLLGGSNNPNNLPELYTSQEDSEFILKFISNYDLKNYALVFPGSKGGKSSIKYWGSEKFAAIIDFIQTDLKLKVVLLGGTDEELICSEIISLCKTQPILLQGQFSLWKSVELLRHAKFYLGSDTSIAHFSAALEIQTIVLLGGGHFKRFFPYPDQKHVKAIYKELSCFNCNWKCTQETNRCIEDISVNDVKRILNSIKIENVSDKESNNKTKNINLVFNTGSKPKIDLLLPNGNMHSWHLKEAWVVNLRKHNLLNRAFYTDSNNYQHFFDYLKKGTNSDFIFALGGDHHLFYLHDSQQKIELWHRYKKSKVCYSYESTIDSEYNFYKNRAENASRVFTHFLVADEKDIQFYKERNNKAAWFPQFVDEKFFFNNNPFDKRINKVFFKGKLWSEYKQRQRIIDSLINVKSIELLDGYINNSELVSNYNKYKAVINPPGVFGGFNVRTFEALSSGNLLFQFLPENRPLNNGLFKHFEHLIYFNPKDTTEIVNHIFDFLSDTESYKTIAENGCNEVLNYHTLEKRLQTLLDFVNLNKTPEYPDYGLADEKVKDNKTSVNQKDRIEVNSEIKLSAIVSVYNSERFIEDCLIDLVEQTLYKKNQLEIILVNTGSQQNEDIIIEKYLNLYKNIKYIKVSERETIYSAWNRGIKAASGKYLTNANTDDRHKKDALEIMCKFLDCNSDVDVVYADQYITTNAKDSWEKNSSKHQQKWSSFDKDLILFGCFIGPQPVWKKSLHDRFGLFNDQLKVVGDYEFWLRISRDAKFYHLKETLGIYYYSPDSAEHRDDSVTKTENKMIQEYYLAQYISSAVEIEKLRKKIKTIDLNKVNDEYAKNSEELLSKREKGILLEKEMDYYLNSIKELSEAEITQLAKHYLQEMEKSESILKKEYYQESINIILGFYYLDNYRLQDSKNCFENILDINSFSSPACEGLGKIFMLESDLNSAKTMLEWAVKNNPQNLNAIEALKTVNQNLSLADDHNSLFENKTFTVESKG
ncbi:MAG: glycosyltransferase [Ignavibacterium sp.]|jgi:ADP-heptose:LPS heptosyltransferase|nr:glycosyltransferase [Ignavibacterium sp.]